MHNVQANIFKATNRMIMNDEFENGDWIHFYEETFNDFFTAADETYVGQINRIVSDHDAGGYDLAYEASKDFLTTNDLRVREVFPITNIGIENLTIQRLDNGSSDTGSNIRINCAVNCWIRGVELLNTCKHHIDISNSSHIEVSGCYINEAEDTGGGSRGYGVVLARSTTNCLIENNIFRKLRHSMATCWGANCNVFAYNYSREQTWDESALDPGPDICLHGTYSFCNLFEGNAVDRIMADATHGMNGPFNTFLRNRHNSPEFTAFLNCNHLNLIGNDHFESVGYNQNAVAEWVLELFVQWEILIDSDYYFDCYFWNFSNWPGWSNFIGFTHEGWYAIQDDAFLRNQVYASSYLMIYHIIIRNVPIILIELITHGHRTDPV